ncbi:hypothetical protein FYK55_17135 [Roseiconus nitratireducens]|uniref:Uncharacterized protein n=1 Tax=Roseiconus nitratireducens TaxID=2605748 RepID=A0A5M6D5S0_9BACT|nr:hypothetical protein [Roseiconus nitratireducens]KAA5541920.1 hypothetical protein FYK55_17135 [Roseiconus nitratireducens]
MLTLIRILTLLAILGAEDVSLAQDLDDLFAGSEAVPLCECRHDTFSLDNPPDWMPDAVKAAVADAARSDKAKWKGAVLFCPTTNAVLERFPLKRAYRFLVCPSDWKRFKPKMVTDKTLTEHGIPIDQIRAMFQSTVMGPIEVSFRARHSRDMMGRVETEDQ